MPRLILLALLALPLLSWSTPVEAGNRRLFGQANRTPQPRNYTPQERAAMAAYPKFTGGFHYRDLHNVGIPNGDIGLRGNGINMSPW